MDGKFLQFLKRNYKFISLASLLAIIIVVLLTQVSLKDPETVVRESTNKVIYEYLDRDTGENSKDTISKNKTRLASVSKKEDAKQVVGNNNKLSSKKQTQAPTVSKNNTTPKQESRQSIGVNKAVVSTVGKTATLVRDDDSGVSKTSLTDYVGGAWAHTGNRYKALINQKVDYSSKIYVYVTVECKEILEDGVECNDTAAWKYVPDDGIIVKRSRVVCSSGENAWDAIARVLNANRIDYAYTGDPPFAHGVESVSSVYGTCYLYRCNHLEAGSSSEGRVGPFGNAFSGWTFTINDIYPGLGMNGTLIKDGDEIVLKYYTGYHPFTMDEEGNF